MAEERGEVNLEQVEVGSLLEAGHQALVVPHFCHHLTPLLDQRTAPASTHLLEDA